MPSAQYKIFSRFVSLLSFKNRINLLYFRRFGRFPNLNKPVSFNEKMQRYKITNRSSLLTVAADKLQSKKMVESICLDDIYIPKTIWETSNVEDIMELDLTSLPKNYVFKANHTSQTIHIIRDSNHLSKSLMMKDASSWMKHDQATVLGEWAYKNIPPKVFIEEFLDFQGHEPDDYKFFVYHGKVHFIQLDQDRFSNHKRNMFDSQWNDLGFDYSYPRKIPVPAKPVYLDKMVDIAEKIGKQFEFVRVDLYWFKDRVTFGELTIYPGAGYEKFPSKDLDLLFGEPW
ncbi:ATP-grasp fold amidoligase family protein [Vibrio breoganii]